MNMKKRIPILALAVVMSFALSFGCARQPSHSRSSKLIKSYFKKYGKKYPATAFGNNKIDTVEITKQEEVHKHLVSIEAFITFKDGSVQRINFTSEKGPLGWRFVSWEDISQ
jgi:hypothetical protein